MKKHKKKIYTEKININEIKDKLSKFSNTLHFLNKNGFYSLDLKKSKELVNIKMPKEFSLIKNPDNVFSLLKEILDSSGFITKQIHFDYSNVEFLDLGAVLLKNVICLSLQKKGIIFSGDFPGVNDLNPDSSFKNKYLEAIEILIFSGIFKVLKINPKDYLDNFPTPLTLELKGNGKNYINIPCKKIKLGRVEDEITQYFNESLKKSTNKELTEDGERIFDKIIGEVIANCQEHTGAFNQYFCSGHFTQLEKDLGKYQLTIFNLGQTIAEGLDSSDKLPKFTKDRIEELIELHSKSNFWNRSHWNRETLLTLYSLQNKVSRMYNQKRKRGTGTITMLKNFQMVGGCNKSENIPQMTIISGNTQIIIDNNPICELNNKKITFNNSKTLNDPPDKNYVKQINSYFPGTIISLSIFLDKKWIEIRQNS